MGYCFSFSLVGIDIDCQRSTFTNSYNFNENSHLLQYVKKSPFNVLYKKNKFI